MAEVDFERTLQRLFADPPTFTDSEAFSDRITRRLDRGWVVRRVMIGGAGLVGGAIGVSQLVVSRFVDRLEATSQGSAKIITAGWNEIAPTADLLASTPFVSPTVLAAMALALVALGFVITRLVGEL